MEDPSAEEERVLRCYGSGPQGWLWQWCTGLAWLLPVSQVMLLRPMDASGELGWSVFVYSCPSGESASH